MYTCKVGVVGIPGKWSTEVLADELETITGYRCVIDMREVLIATDMQLMHRGQHLRDLDAVIIKKLSEVYSPHTVELAHMLQCLEKQGVRTFSPAKAIGGMVSRAACTQQLLAGHIPMPDTVMTTSINQAIASVKAFGEAVFKPLFSTKARGMVLLNANMPMHELQAAIEQFNQHNPLMYIQRKVELNGQDLGLVFLNGQYLGAYARVGAKAAWNTTIHAGGHYAPASPSAEMIDIATRAQALFGLSFTTVDVAETPDGPVVFEVSAFGGFKGAKEGAGINAAKLYAEYVASTVSAAKKGQ